MPASETMLLVVPSRATATAWKSKSFDPPRFRSSGVALRNAHRACPPALLDLFLIPRTRIRTPTTHTGHSVSRVSHLELRRADGQLIGSFNERQVALRIARTVLDDENRPLILDSFDDTGRKITEALVSRRKSPIDQPAKR